jgi:hypothetical protein
MQTLPFATEWRASFGDALPAGFLCRAALADRWLRVHSLSESKRYAETEADQAELLRRQNDAASYVLGEDADCLVLVTRFGERQAWSFEGLPLNGKAPVHVLSVGDDDDKLQFFGLPVKWRKGTFNELLLAVADDRTGPVLFANVQRRRIYAPYDGGADLFFPSPETTQLAREHFQDWLSVREDGP